MTSPPSTKFRRWLHPIPIIGVSLWVLAILAAAYIITWCYTATPSPISHAADMADLVQSAQPGQPLGPPAPIVLDPGEPTPDLTGRSAWEALEAVLADFPARTAAIAPIIEFYLLNDGYEEELDEFPPPDHPQYQTLLADLNARRAIAAGALTQLAGSPLEDLLGRLAATHGGARTTYGSGVLLLPLPELGQARAVARYLFARARTATEARHADEALRAIEWALALGRVHGFQGTLIQRLVAIAIVHGALGELRHAIDQGVIDASRARRALLILDRQCTWPDMRVVWEGERLIAREGISTFYSSGGLIPGRFLPVYHESFLTTGGPAGFGAFESLKNIPGLWAPSRGAVTRELDRNIDVAISLRDTTRPARRAMGDPFAPPPGSGAAAAILGPLVPAYFSAQAAEDQYRATLGGIRTRLALILYHDHHSRWPGALDDLVPGVLPGLPRDPYAADGRLVYRREGESFVLYSVGNDAQDDGGTFGARRWQEGFMQNVSGLDVRFGPPATP